jgi:arginyl-tRNA synthetase
LDGCKTTKNYNILALELSWAKTAKASRRAREKAVGGFARRSGQSYGKFAPRKDQAEANDKRAKITQEEVDAVAEAIGYGAVKYYDLRRNPTSNYKFSYDQMLSTNGDTAVYLLYARVRLESIVTKAQAEFGVNLEELLQSKEQVVIEHASERNLAFHLL